jgi:hypothetical protein
MNKFANELSKTIPVAVDSIDYKQIMYNLTLNLGLPSADITVDSISTVPPNYSGFNKSENENCIYWLCLKSV